MEAEEPRTRERAGIPSLVGSAFKPPLIYPKAVIVRIEESRKKRQEADWTLELV